ncbi:MAG: metal-dependent transcriptional regulator [Lachnospiraceae bacterium]|nr:metal-dependent transcriptional regulator [Lachnospiraceae bacterium]
MSLKESGEMYLESIYVLSRSKQPVRSIDIAEYMNFTKPSVSRGVGLLKEQGYIVVDKDGYISFTDDGAKIAEKIYERHTVLTNVLKAIGIDEETAAEDACRIEHVISEKTFIAIKEYLQLNMQI